MKSGSRGLPREIVVLYEDRAVIAVDKPAGLPSVPVPGSRIASVLSVLGEALAPRRQRAYTVHRIDRFTSGILLFAKSERERQVLIAQFLAHTPVRQYLAVVRGQPREEAGTLVHYLRRDGMFQKVSSAEDGKAARAELRYRVERRLAAAALVRVELVTGLQNQIRVQFAAAGHPVVGDRKYRAAEAAEQRIERVALHACHLEFAHPVTGKKVSLDSAPPRDFQLLLQTLAKG